MYFFENLFYALHKSRMERKIGTCTEQNSSKVHLFKTIFPLVSNKQYYLFTTGDCIQVRLGLRSVL